MFETPDSGSRAKGLAPETHRITWRGIESGITFAPERLGMSDHIELHTAVTRCDRRPDIFPIAAGPPRSAVRVSVNRWAGFYPRSKSRTWMGLPARALPATVPAEAVSRALPHPRRPRLPSGRSRYFQLNGSHRSLPPPSLAVLLMAATARSRHPLSGVLRPGVPRRSVPSAQQEEEGPVRRKVGGFRHLHPAAPHRVGPRPGEPLRGPDPHRPPA